MGEMIVGILLGPTVFGFFAPDLFNSLFPSTGPVAISLQAMVRLSVVMLLLWQEWKFNCRWCFDRADCTFHQSHEYDRSFQSWILDFLALAWNVFKRSSCPANCIFVVFELPLPLPPCLLSPGFWWIWICIKQKSGCWSWLQQCSMILLVGWYFLLYSPWWKKGVGTDLGFNHFVYSDFLEFLC